MSASGTAARPPRVVVLMSTYQGEAYLAEQLRSILTQLPADGQLLVRDDGSTDRTVAIVCELADPRVQLTRGTNLGFGGSFLTLLAMASPDADLVMFADQDDVWLPGKIERAWQHLQPLGAVPALYGSAQMLVDANLQPLHATPPWPGPPSFAGALMENMITGCTAALNRPALRLLQRAGVPAGVRFHDWWLYLVVSAFGQVVIDDQPTLLYRQHGRNQIGRGAGWWDRQRQYARFLLRNDWVGILLTQAAELMRCYGRELAPARRRLVEQHFRQTEGRWVPAWPLVFSLRRWRHLAVHELALRLLLALYRLRLWPPPGRRLG